MNTKNIQYSDSNSVYPGIYTPVFTETEELIKELKNHKIESYTACINVIEYNDFYKMEVVAPGSKKEDICVLINHKKLAVCVLHPEGSNEEAKYHIRQFNFCPACAVITIPENIDSDFIVSFYDDGILSIYCPKTVDPFKRRRGKIAVY